MKYQAGFVYLVGAGCGAADLITLRGYDCLRRCQTVIFDDLIDDALLDAVPAQAERIYVGKRRGHCAMPQENICALLVEKAEQGNIVVRLKGGDPFVFGRGGEEIEALRKAGVMYEEVPGITSAIAIPAGAGIPVTHRGLSKSVHIITGSTANTPDGLPQDIDRLAQLDGTLVILMGLHHIEALSGRLLAAGKPPHTPAAVISGGNVPHPAVVRGTLKTIAALARQNNIGTPAVIVVGSVAALDFSVPVPACQPCGGE